MGLKNNNMWQYLALAGNIGAVIALPLVALAILGRFLDRKWETSPWIFITSIVLAFIISTFILATKTLQAMKALESTHDEKNTSAEDRYEDEESWSDLDEEEDE